MPHSLASRGVSRRGFSVLEGLVAIVILGLTLIPIATFISQSALQLRAVDESNGRNFALQDVLAFLETLNPMVDPRGTVTLGDISVSWAAVPLVPANTNPRIGTGLASYAVAFYKVDLSVFRQQERSPWFSFEARKIGYRKLQLSGIVSP